MLLSELAFASFFAYAPNPNNPSQKEAQQWTYGLKQDKMTTVRQPPQLVTQYLASLVAKYIQDTPLRDFFRSHAILVPMPKSSLPRPGGLWVPERLAKALAGNGLGEEVVNLLKRIKPIPKAAWCAPWERPTPSMHYESLSVTYPLVHPDIIIIVDDIVTRGASMIGAASVLLDAFPNAKVSGFAMIRTISNASKFVAFFDPQVGIITRLGESTHREP